MRYAVEDSHGCEFEMDMLDGCCGVVVVNNLDFKHFDGDYVGLTEYILKRARNLNYANVLITGLDPSNIQNYRESGWDYDTSFNPEYNVHGLIEAGEWDIVHTFVNKFKTGNTVIMAVKEVPDEI